MNNCEAISKFIVVNYKHGWPEISMTVNKIENPIFTIPEVTEDMSIREEILVWKNKYKEVKSKNITFK